MAHPLGVNPKSMRAKGVNWHVYQPSNFGLEGTMGLLRDQDLVTNLGLAQAARYVDGITLPADPFSRESPVQASSMELHIGDIYLPEAKEGPDGAAQAKTDHVLKTGETAVLMTRETLQLPAHVAAFGFPPSRVSFKGLLMTNPGHVDPGYTGRLRFTVINMSKDPFPLSRGDAIVKLLFFTLDNPAQANWSQRNPKGYPPPSQAEVNRLSKDFVDVENRAESIAKKQGVQWAAGITVAATLILGLFQLNASGHLFGNKAMEDKIRDLDTNQKNMEQQMKVDKRLTDLERRLNDIEAQQKKGQAGAQKPPKDAKKGTAGSQ